MMMIDDDEDDDDDEADKIPTHHLVFCLLVFCPLGFIPTTPMITMNVNVNVEDTATSPPVCPTSSLSLPFASCTLNQPLRNVS